jgi:signal transduction histidine kinase
LLVEDDASVVASLRLFLKSDYEVHSASTVRSGVDLFTSLRPSLVVLDLRLADGNGLDVLREIRGLNPIAPVIVLTGYASMKTAEESLRLGASDYLHKPFDGYKLISRINELTEGVLAPHREIPDDSETISVLMHRIDELERKARSASLFLHDAANPVTTALTASQFLCDAIESEPEQFDEEIRSVSNLLHEAMGFIAGMFEQSGSIECMRRLETSEVAIHRIVDLAVNMARSEAEDNQVTVSVCLQNREATVWVNRFALARVLLNLLRNAIEAVKPHTGRVALMADVIDGHVELCVRDNGPGISSDLMKRIFEEHFTTKAEGKGLGLYICKRLIENMSGTLSVRNEPNEGCCFFIRIPCNL